MRTDRATVTLPLRRLAAGDFLLSIVDEKQVADFVSRAGDHARAVDKRLAEFLRQEQQITNLHDGMMYSMGLDVDDLKVRGKRIRPVLGLMTAEALGASANHAMAFACAIELLHNFALVHDDIEDGDTQRRGRDCVWRKWGLAHGINIGDFMLSKVFSILLHDEENPDDVRHRLLLLLSETMDHIFVGQSLDISARDSREFTMEDYERLVQKKTGSYLAAPMIGGAIVAGADERTIESLRRFGAAMGPMFQIRDDLIDLTAEKGRGCTGNDIREGKRSWLVAALMRECSPAEKAAVYEVLDKPREETTAGDVESVVSLFREHGIFDRAQRECARLLGEGLAALEDMPPKLKETLQTAAEVLAQRTT